MLCDNCKKREANVRYSENINGVRRELNLCEECSKKLGIGEIGLDMPINFSSFFGDFIEDFSNTEFMPMFNEFKTLKCDHCGYTFEDIAHTGRVGCANCYDVFQDRLDPIIRRIQSSNHHVGRLGKSIDKKIEERQERKEHNEQRKKEETPEEKLEGLKEDLKQAIKEERYEDAAKLRDEIKKIEENNK